MRQFFFFFFVVLGPHGMMAQEAKDVFNASTPITWLGLDFTGAKFIGDRERLGSEDDVRKLIASWNDLMISEPTKYDLSKALHRSAVKQAIDIALTHNERLNLKGTLEESGTSHLNKEDVYRIVSSYNFGEQSSIGILFVVDSFNKLAAEGSVWVTFINMSTKEVLFTNRLVGKPAGFGVRNFWAAAIYNILKKVNADYDKWERNY